MIIRIGLLRSIAVSAVALLFALAAVAWLSGWFEPKVEPGRASTAGEPVGLRLVPVELATAPVVTSVVGTVESAHETKVASRLLARIKQVNVIAGQTVAAGDVLVQLDEEDVKAQINQARANVDAATARQAQAQSDLEKVTRLRSQGAATQRELEDAQRAEAVARAGVEAYQHALEEATAQLQYTTVKATTAGVVIDKHVREGDLARPGEPLVTLYDPARLQLVAPVPERLAASLMVNQPVTMQIDALRFTCDAAITEIVPQASPQSRSFDVKAAGPSPPGAFSGMFGRLLIETGTRQRLLVPVDAVRRVGQVEMVQVVKGGGDGADAQPRTERRFVRTGEAADGKVEVLAGLTPGDRVESPFSQD